MSLQSLDFVKWATWATVWLAENDDVGINPRVEAASCLLRQLISLPFPVAIACALQIRARIREQSFDPAKSSLAIVNDRYILWDDRPGVFDSLTCRAVEITLRPTKVVRYDPNGHLGALHAADTPQHVADAVPH